MTEKEKLLLAQMQVGNILELLKGNEYESMLINKMVSVYYELNRQITNLNVKKGETSGQLEEVSTKPV